MTRPSTGYAKSLGSAHAGDCISDVLPAVPGIQKDIRHNRRKTAALQKNLRRLRKLAQVPDGR
ncbi:MAG: hypothetical protein ACLU3I_06615 [Acutalibacteraceae bacterium]